MSENVRADELTPIQNWNVKSFGLSFFALCLVLFLAPIIGGIHHSDQIEILPSEFVGSILNGQSGLLTHALLATLISIGVTALFVKRKVVQIPFTPLLFLTNLFGGLLLASIVFSQARWMAIYHSLAWIAYLLIFMLAIATVGRNHGAKVALLAFVLGCIYISLSGILEYQAQRSAGDATWRIFSTWMNPNALAGILLLGFFAALGLVMTLPRIQSLILGFGGVLIGFALVLTQSRGGMLALLVGLCIFGLVSLLFAKRENRLILVRPWIVIGTVGLLMIAWSKAPTTPAAPGKANSPVAVSRVATQSSELAQSSEFRKSLWKGSVELMKSNPLGYGGGSYTFLSTRPGLTTSTPLTHNSFLQVGVEFGIATMLVLLAVGFLWSRDVFRGMRQATHDSGMIRAAIFAAISASVAHSLFDSDLSYFGNGVAFFALLGIALPLCADGITPEYIPKQYRVLGIGFAVLSTFGLLWTGYGEAQQALARGAVSEKNMAVLESAIKSAQALAPMDGETWFLSSYLAKSPAESASLLRRANECTPLPRYFRAEARALIDQGKKQEAMRALGEALINDPNNLPALILLVQLNDELGFKDSALKYANRLVAIQNSDFFKIRAIPEDVPTETYLAHAYLAEATTNPKERADYYEIALEGYEKFALLTVPRIELGTLPGKSISTAVTTLQQGLGIADRLLTHYQEQSLLAEVVKMDKRITALKEVLSRLEQK